MNCFSFNSLSEAWQLAPLCIYKTHLVNNSMCGPQQISLFRDTVLFIASVPRDNRFMFCARDTLG